MIAITSQHSKNEGVKRIKDCAMRECKKCKVLQELVCIYMVHVHVYVPTWPLLPKHCSTIAILLWLASLCTSREGEKEKEIEQQLSLFIIYKINPVLMYMYYTDTYTCSVSFKPTHQLAHSTNNYKQISPPSRLQEVIYNIYTRLQRVGL